MTFSKVSLLTIAMLIVIGASLASAQTPYISVFWDITTGNDGVTEAAIPPGVGVVDSFYVIGYNLNCTVTGVQYKVECPLACINFIADIGTPPVTVGNICGIGANQGITL